MIGCQLLIWSHLVVTASLQGQQYYSHFADEKWAAVRTHNFLKVTEQWFEDLKSDLADSKIPASYST